MCHIWQSIAFCCSSSKFDSSASMVNHLMPYVLWNSIVSFYLFSLNVSRNNFNCITCMPRERERGGGGEKKLKNVKQLKLFSCSDCIFCGKLVNMMIFLDYHKIQLCIFYYIDSIHNCLNIGYVQTNENATSNKIFSLFFSIFIGFYFYILGAGGFALKNLAFEKGYTIYMKKASGKRRKISTDIGKLAKSQRMLNMKANYFIICVFLFYFNFSIYQNAFYAIFITGKNNIIFHVSRQSTRFFPFVPILTQSSKIF